MNDPQPVSPSARLRTLLAIPERQRTDAEWDEINELEIMLASGNRQGAPQQQNMNRNMSGQGGHPNSGGRPNNPGGRPNNPGGQPRGNKPMRKFHQRPPKQRNQP